MFITGVCRFVSLFLCNAATKTPPCISRMHLNTHRMSSNTRRVTVAVLMDWNFCPLRNFTPKTRLLTSVYSTALLCEPSVCMYVVLCLSLAVGWLKNMRNGCR